MSVPVVFSLATKFAPFFIISMNCIYVLQQKHNKNFNKNKQKLLVIWINLGINDIDNFIDNI